jgi:hypothetical protein
MIRIHIHILALAVLAGCQTASQKPEAPPVIEQPDYLVWQSITNGTPCSRAIKLLGEPDRSYGGGVLLHFGTVVPKSDVMPEHICFSLNDFSGEAWHLEDPFDGRFSTNGLPTTPELVFPYEATVLSHDPPYIDFRWKPSSGQYPMHYEIKVTPGVNGRTAVPHYATKAVVNVTGTQTIHWCVRAINALGAGDWSEESSFTFINKKKKANKVLHGDE